MSGSDVKRLRLYQRPSCHLCEDMLAQLEALEQAPPFELVLIDVDEDAAGHGRYRDRVPVLEDAAGNLLSEVYLDPIAVLSYLRHA